MVEERTSDGIMFKKVDNRISKFQTDRVNEEITEASNLIRAESRA